MTLQTLGQHSWNLQQTQQRFQLRQSERSSRLMTVRKTRRFKGFCVHGRCFGDAEANSLSEIQHLNQSKAVQQSVQFPAEGGNIAVLLLQLYFKRRKRKGASRFTILDLQLSISRVQFCSSKGYLRRSIMQAAVVVILKQNRTKDGFAVAYVSEMSEADTIKPQCHSLFHTPC